MELVGPRDQIETAHRQLAIALKILDTCNSVLISDRKDLLEPRRRLAAAKTELVAIARQLEEIAEELTPLRASSQTDMRAAFVTASEFPRSK